MSIYVTNPKPYYGAFSDTTTQPIASVTVAYPVKLNTTDYSHGVTVVSDGTNPTRVTIANAGLYNIQFSFQFANASTNSAQNVDIWLRTNETDIAGSNGRVSIPASHGGEPGKLITGWNYFAQFTQNQYFQIMWHGESTDITMPYLAADTTPTVPTTASAILTVSQVA
jgi:hypothetical protein